MAHQIFNSLEKLNPPPFVTTSVNSKQAQRIIHKTWYKLRSSSSISEKSRILESEAELLAGFIERKGTQLRLEKALMLSNRIHKLGKRWLTNKFIHEYTVFDDGVQLSLKSKSKSHSQGTSSSSSSEEESESESDEGIPIQMHKKEIVIVEESQGLGARTRDSGNGNPKGIRLPSRQWANWIIYLTLRDSLILAKIKCECERTVKYWLGLISSSHHATDSLVAVGILSRMWYVSSALVESLISVMYPSVCKLSIHLEPTKAENWLTDLEIPSPEKAGEWLATILGSPFTPASLSGGLGSLDTGSKSKKKAKMESVLQLQTQPQPDSKSISEISISGSTAGTEQIVSVAATATTALSSDSDEDLGVPVEVDLPTPTCSSSLGLEKDKKKKQGKSKNQNSSGLTLNDKWTRFFTGYKSKLKNSKGKKQFIVRIRKYLQDENDRKIIVQLKKLRESIKSGTYEEIIEMANQFQKFLAQQSS